MHVAITGATGRLGRTLSHALRADGHRVTGITRSRPGPAELQWSPAEGRLDARGLRGVDAVIHLAGEPIDARRWSRAQKGRIVDSRVQSTTLIAQTLADMDRGPRTLISVSGIDYYGDRGDEVLTEESTAGDSFLARVCVRWEASADPARAAGIRVVHPRTGIVQLPDAGALARLLPLFRFGLGGRFGSGRQWWSWIMPEDLIGIYRHVLRDESVVGPVNATAPEPVTNATYTKVLGRVLRRPTVLRFPTFGPKLVLGELAEALVFHSHRVLPHALLASGYRFRYPGLEAGLRSILT
jgi:uncharacterized protein